MLNIAFDGKSPEELITFVQNVLVPLTPEDREQINIKVNDLLAEIGTHGLEKLHADIFVQTGISLTWMIDGKWSDIPNTVANYAKRLRGLPVAYYTVHASGGAEMIRAAKQTVPEIKLLAITVLTSMQEVEVKNIYDTNRSESILRLAKSALSAGADGLVCSPADAPMLRAVFGSDFLLVTPNISRAGVARNDDQNVALTQTPAGAIENGASDIVVGRPIFQSENPGEVIWEMIAQMRGSKQATVNGGQYAFEKMLHTGDWESLLKHIGAMYRRPENGKYMRLTSGFLSDMYFNMGTSEVDYRVLDRASRELSVQISEAHISGTMILGAQMGSVRLSLALARAMNIYESIYTEKDGDSMALKRHSLGEKGFAGKRVILSEDVVTQGSTIKKMIEMVRSSGGEVVAITCIINRTGREHDFAGIPLFSCYVAPPFSLWWDSETLAKTRANELSTGKNSDQIDEIIVGIQSNNLPLPEGSMVAEKPKNEWKSLIGDMNRERTNN